MAAQYPYNIDGSTREGQDEVLALWSKAKLNISSAVFILKLTHDEFIALAKKRGVSPPSEEALAARYAEIDARMRPLIRKPTIHWRTTWANGDPTHLVTVTGASAGQRLDIEAAADREGFTRDGDHWTLPDGPRVLGFFEVARTKGFDLDFEKEDENAPVNLQRLKLEPETLKKLETIPNFVLGELAGYCPVQGQGDLDGQYFYFRARGAYWRFEVGGNESGTRGPKWWHEEDWPSEDGFAAGYLTDEEAITCILKAVEAYRTEDRSRFEKGHPDYERTTLEGWSLGALSLRRAIRRLGISGQEVIARATDYGIELPYFADRELKSLDSEPSTVLGLDRASGKWIEIKDEDG